MRELRVRRIDGFDEAAERALLKKIVRPSDYDTVISEPTVIYDEDERDGEPVIVYLGNASSLLAGYTDILDALHRIEYRDTARGLQRVIPKGGKSARGVARIVGYQPRYPLRRDYCTAASCASQHPREHAVICSYADKLSAIYAQLNPRGFARQRDLVHGAVKPHWRIGESVFTSGICNRDNALPYHYDSGNFSGVWSAMIALHRDMDGGRLVVPRYRLAFEFEGVSAIMFDGQGVLHGVEPFHRRSSNAYRYSVVFYAMRLMCHCTTPKEELERVRKLKTEREVARLDPEEVLRRKREGSSQAKKKRKRGEQTPEPTTPEPLVIGRDTDRPGDAHMRAAARAVREAARSRWNEELMPAFARFATAQVSSWDIDPMYPVLREVLRLEGVPREVAIWRTFLYVAWYHIGSAERAWTRYPEPREIHETLRLSTGTERRSFRGNDKAAEHINATVATVVRGFGSFERWVEATTEPGGEKGWARVRAAFASLPHAGHWSSYKWADLLKHVLDVDITANDIGVGGGGETAGPVPGMVRLTGEDWRRCAGDVGLQKELLAESVRRGVPFDGLDQLETALCDFNSLAAGRYYVGHDIDMQMEHLAESSEVFWAARRSVIPAAYLGELHGWRGVDKARKGVFARTGEVVLR